MSYAIDAMDFDASLEIEDDDIAGIMTSPETKLSADMLVYSSPVLISLITVASILASYVTAKSSRNILSTCLYLSVGQAFDVVLVWLRMGNDYVGQITGTNVKHISTVASNSACKLFPFVTGLFTHLSIWLVVCIAVETAILASRPHRVAKVCQLVQARNIMILLLVLLICVNAHCFWTYRLVRVETSKINAMVCTNIRQGKRSGSDNFRMITWPIVEIFVADLCPFASVLACVVIVAKSRRRRSDVAGALSAHMTRPDHALQYHDALHAVCVAYLAVHSLVMTANAFGLCVRAGGVSLVEWTPRLEARQRLTGTVSLLAQEVLALAKPVILFCYAASFRDSLGEALCCKPRSPVTVAVRDTTEDMNLGRVKEEPRARNHGYRQRNTDDDDERDAGGGVTGKHPPPTSARTHYSTTSV